jgi:DNA-binding transcriptional regulator YiaG
MTRAPSPEELTSDDAELLAWTREACVSGEAREIRLDARLSSVEGSRVVGVSHTAILHWEAGTRLPRGERAIRYGRFLRMLQRRADQ